jgi:hypothetical protein
LELAARHARGAQQQNSFVGDRLASAALTVLWQVLLVKHSQQLSQDASSPGDIVLLELHPLALMLR